MAEYHKINALYKRETSGPRKGKFIIGDWADPAFAYLAENRWEFTEKVDGTNIRVYLNKARGFVTGRYAGRSDNADIPKPLLEHLGEVFPVVTNEVRYLPTQEQEKRNQEIYDWMNRNGLTEVVLYGEGYGPKIQGGGKYRNDQSFVLFDVKIGDFWLARGDVNDIADKLGIDSVPVIGFGTLYDAIDLVTHRPAVGVFRAYDGLQSEWGPFEAEGIVARPVVPLFNRKGERIITKIKAVDFR